MSMAWPWAKSLARKVGSSENPLCPLPPLASAGVPVAINAAAAAVAMAH
jgi:hypothetical protein